MAETDATRCHLTSLAANEPLAGTVKPVVRWLLLEYDGRWEPQALEDCGLPQAVRRALLDWRAAQPQSRVLLIRQKPRRVQGGLVCFTVQAGPTPHVRRFALDAYEDLLARDILGAFESPVSGGEPVSEPLALVCTHGRRDRCCASHGIPVYERLAALDGEHVWQTSHVGGHRFAANVLMFPHGLVYGRVTPDSAPALWTAYRDGHLDVAHYRGRAAYPQPVQAAEAWWCGVTGQTALNAFRLKEVTRHDSGQWRVTFGTAAGRDHEVMVSEQAGGHVLASCGDANLTSFTRFVPVALDGTPLTEAAPPSL